MGTQPLPTRKRKSDTREKGREEGQLGGSKQPLLTLGPTLHTTFIKGKPLWLIRFSCLQAVWPISTVTLPCPLLAPSSHPMRIIGIWDHLHTVLFLRGDSGKYKAHSVALHVLASGLVWTTCAQVLRRCPQDQFLNLLVGELSWLQSRLHTRHQALPY